MYIHIYTFTYIYIFTLHLYIYVNVYIYILCICIYVLHAENQRKVYLSVVYFCLIQPDCSAFRLGPHALFAIVLSHQVSDLEKNSHERFQKVYGEYSQRNV